MNSHLKTKLLFANALLASAALTACGGNGTPSGVESSAVPSTAALNFSVRASTLDVATGLGASVTATANITEPAPGGLDVAATAFAELDAERASAVRGPRFSPYTFGAKGDGVSDDTAALNAAAQAASAQNGILVIPEGIFLLNNWLRINRGVRGVVGKGGVIKLKSAADAVGVLIPSGEFPPEGAYPLIIQGLTIDVDNTYALPIYGQNVNKVYVVGNRILNNSRGVGILLRTFGTSYTTDNVVKGNYVQGYAGASPAPDWTGIQVDSDLALGAGITSVIDYWKIYYSSPFPQGISRNNVIEDNHVVGAYYGVAVSGVANVTIVKNKLEDNIRNISMQNRVMNSVVSNNILRNSVSSAIHLAYGSSNNRIEGNDIRTSRAQGEGILQAYVESENNTFASNTVVVEHPTGPTFFAYTGTHTNGNKFIGNTFDGPCTKAYYGVESGWNTVTANPASRAYLNDPVVNNYAVRNSAGTLIANNQITAASTSPVFFFGQTSDSGGVYRLSGVEIRNNRATVPAGGTGLRLAENTAGTSSAHIAVGNSIIARDGSNPLAQAPRGLSHFAQFTGNAGINLQP
jgi:Periplasmic copper-binding protein (NosD)/Pectate lyase superfamily protein